VQRLNLSTINFGSVQKLRPRPSAQGGIPNSSGRGLEAGADLREGLSPPRASLTQKSLTTLRDI
jgi:hypothetical protein